MDIGVARLRFVIIGGQGFRKGTITIPSFNLRDLYPFLFFFYGDTRLPENK